MTNPNLAEKSRNVNLKKTYSEKLRDPRWQKKRLEIMEAASFTCTWCGDADKTLQIHHTYYQNNKDPWEYENTSLKCLCDDCHKNISEAKKEFGLLISNVKREESDLDKISGFILGLSLYKNPNEKIEIKNFEAAEGVGMVFYITPELVIDNLDDGFMTGVIMADIIINKLEHNYIVLSNWAEDVINAK